MVRRILGICCMCLLAAIAGRAAAADAPEISGKYTYVGDAGGGKTYSGVAAVTREGDGYTFLWTEPSGKQYHGYGIRDGELVAVTVRDPANAAYTGIVIYHVEKGPKLVGRWSTAAMKGTTLAETLTAAGRVEWKTDAAEAQKLAAQQGKPLLVHFGLKDPQAAARVARTALEEKTFLAPYADRSVFLRVDLDGDAAGVHDLMKALNVPEKSAPCLRLCKIGKDGLVELARVRDDLLVREGKDGPAQEEDAQVEKILGSVFHKFDRPADWKAKTGVAWADNMSDAFRKAFDQKKVMVVYFTSDWCMHCDKVDALMTDEMVLAPYKDRAIFVVGNPDWDDRFGNVQQKMKELGVDAFPTFVVLSVPDMKELGRVVGSSPKDVTAKKLAEAFKEVP